jgi:hypothetical protein
MNYLTPWGKDILFKNILFTRKINKFLALYGATMVSVPGQNYPTHIIPPFSSPNHLTNATGKGTEGLTRDERLACPEDTE